MSQCVYTIEDPNGALPGRRPRPWWHRQCKRTAKPGSLYCWQHQSREVRP